MRVEADIEPLAHQPRDIFVGRTRELRGLEVGLAEMLSGRGRLTLLAGEPGIGKTRTAAEFATIARRAGAVVLWGGCYDGEWAPPFGPFAEAIAAYARQADADTLRHDLGLGAAPLARVVPAVRERLPDVPEPAPLQPDEERFRLLDAVSQFLIATAARVPVLVVLDDLHWADKGTIAMLRHVARFAPQHRLLLLGTYRDVELEPQHPLTDALGALYRETTCERIALKGLDAPEVAQLIAEGDVAPDKQDALATTISAVTNGNPFFVREVLRHLLEEGQLGRSKADPLNADTIGIPDSVRQVLSLRVRRLAAETGRLLCVAAAFGGPFHLTVAGQVAGLDEATALDALDDALRVKLLRPADSAERYDFTHALIRETLYSELSPSRQARLHRQLAQAMEEIYAGSTAEHAAEIAQQYYRSKDLPGAARGANYAITAAERADAGTAWEDVGAFLRMALTMMGSEDARRPRVLARLGRSLALIPEPETALTTIQEAVELLNLSEGVNVATDYVGEMLELLYDAGLLHQAFALAGLGLARVGAARDARWARFAALAEVGRELSDPHGPTLQRDTPERWEIGGLLGSDPSHVPGGYALNYIPYADRADALRRGARLYITGDYRAEFPTQRAERWEREGRIARAVDSWCAATDCHIALGQFPQARRTLDRAVRLARRLTLLLWHTTPLIGAQDRWRRAMDDGWDQPMETIGPGMASGALAGLGGGLAAGIARIHARQGRVERAMRRLSGVLPVIEHAPGWATDYVSIVCDAAETLWLAARTDHIETIERNLREKTVVPDFRSPMVDGRLALARLCALQGRYDEAVEWFAKSRTVLDEQGARPLRAIVDYDEALMYVRRGEAGDAERARRLLDVALRQFSALGMSGWIRRAESLLHDGHEWVPAPPPQPPAGPAQHDIPLVRPATDASDASPPATTGQPPQANLFRREGHYWTVAYTGQVVRLKDSKGLQYLARLLRHPGQEILAIDLAQSAENGDRGLGERMSKPTPAPSSATPALDAQAKAAYKRRLEALRDELSEAEANNDIGRAEQARSEMDMLTEQLRGALGLGGRDRPVANDLERARSAVGKRIRVEIRRIRAAHLSLGRHLTATVTTGYFCAYEPERDVPVHWKL